MHNKPDIALIRRYVHGELSPQEMYEVEKAAEADELVMDVLVGMESEYAQGVHDQVMPELQQRIQQRSKSQPRRIQTLPYRWIGLAASLLLVLGIGMYIFLKPEGTVQQIVQNTAQDTPSKYVPVLPPSSTDSTATATNKKPAMPKRNQEKALAYNNVESNASKQQKNTVASRRAALDTIPIQIVPSNNEELISLILGDDQHTLTAHNNPAARAKTSARAAQTIVPGQETTKNIQPVSLQDLKSITTGIVIDGETQRPIVGAMIRDRQMNALVKTDSNGRFIVGSTDEKPVLSIQSDGFERADHIANGAMRIALKRQQPNQSSSPSDVSLPMKTLGKSRPEMGSKAYRLHLDSLAKASGLGAGEVVLLFTINAQGRPTNIRVKNSSGKRRQDEEAIRILKNGPNWVKGRNEEVLEWKIQF